MHFPVAHYAEETGGLAACVTSFSGSSAVLLTIRYLSHLTVSLTGGLGRGKLTGCSSCSLCVPVQVRKPIGQCWVDLSRWHLWQSLWQKPVKCLVIGSSRIFWGGWLKVETTKALISLPLFQQELTLSESKLALYEKVLCLFVTYFYHLPLVFKE